MMRVARGRNPLLYYARETNLRRSQEQVCHVALTSFVKPCGAVCGRYVL